MTKLMLTVAGSGQGGLRLVECMLKGQKQHVWRSAEGGNEEVRGYSS